MILGLFFAVAAGQTFQVCGNYCGPGWCAATWIDETPCVNQGYWGADDDGSCIDQCCKAHDYCCGAGDRSQCNDMIANCAYYCSGPCADVVWGWMRLADTFCCGGPCDQSQLDFLESTFGKRPSGVPAKEGDRYLKERLVDRHAEQAIALAE